MNVSGTAISDLSPILGSQPSHLSVADLESIQLDPSVLASLKFFDGRRTSFPDGIDFSQVTNLDSALLSGAEFGRNLVPASGLIEFMLLDEGQIDLVRPEAWSVENLTVLGDSDTTITALPKNILALTGIRLAKDEAIPDSVQVLASVEGDPETLLVYENEIRANGREDLAKLIQARRLALTGDAAVAALTQPVAGSQVIAVSGYLSHDQIAALKPHGIELLKPKSMDEIIALREQFLGSHVMVALPDHPSLMLPTLKTAGTDFLTDRGVLSQHRRVFQGAEVSLVQLTLLSFESP